MRILTGTQLVVSVVMALVTFMMFSEGEAIAVLYGGFIAVVVTLLAIRSTDKALDAAVENTGHALVAMFSGFALRYAVAILGLLTGFKALKLLAIPMLLGFIIIVMVQIAVSFTLKSEPQHGTNQD